jgi:hypothetical protein
MMVSLRSQSLTVPVNHFSGTHTVKVAPHQQGDFLADLNQNIHPDVGFTVERASNSPGIYHVTVPTKYDKAVKTLLDQYA